LAKPCVRNLDGDESPEEAAKLVRRAVRRELDIIPSQVA
jgi:hypothetical protein